MDYKGRTLDNGLRVMSIPMPSLPSFTLTVWVKTGSRFEEKKVNGISHFLEHMVFKGSEARPSAKQISEAVDAMGGEFNAATAKDWTNFYIKARPENLETALDILSDMVLNPLLREEEIEKEKGVIIEEIAMYEDTPVYKIGDIFEQLIFEGSSLGRDIAGTAESVKSIKKDDFIRYRERHYYPENMLITVAGGIKEKETVDLVEGYFGKLKSQSSKVKTITQNFKTAQTKPRVKLHSKKKEQAHLVLGFSGDARGYEGRFAQGVLAAILGGGMSSRLFIEVREKRGLAYAVKTGIERYSDTGYLDTYAGVDPQKIEEALAVMLEQHYKIRNSKFEIRNFELHKAKEYLKGHLALTLEDTKEVNSFFAEQELFLEKILTPEEIYKKVDKVSLEAVYREAKRLFRPERLNLAIIGPYEDAGKFEKLLR